MVDFDEIDAVIERITNVYKEKIFPNLKEQSVTIYDSINSKLEEICRRKSMYTSNSVYPELFPFSIIYREKRPISLKEKLIRNELIDRINDIDEEKIKVNILNEIDDLVGLTILVDTSKYLDFFSDIFFEEEVSSLKILNDKKESLKEIGDLKYYNIKTEFDDLDINLNVEIQIKSAMVSSFLNLQHKLIYKNHHVSVTKKNNDFVLQAITPAINAVEAVIDTVENFGLKNDDEIIEYSIKKKVENLIHSKIPDGQSWDSYTEKITHIFMRAVNGFSISKRLKFEEAIINEFWKINDAESEESTLKCYNLKSSDYIIKIMSIIINVSENLIMNILLNDYYNLKKDLLNNNNNNWDEQLEIFNQYFKKFINYEELFVLLFLDKECNVMNSLIEAHVASEELVDDNEDWFLEIGLSNNEIKKLQKFYFEKGISKLLHINIECYEKEENIFSKFDIEDDYEDILMDFYSKLQHDVESDGEYK